MLTIKLRKSADGQFYFTAFAENGEALVHSETYTRKEKMIEGYKKLKKGMEGEVEVGDFTNVRTGKTRKKKEKEEAVPENPADLFEPAP